MMLSGTTARQNDLDRFYFLIDQLRAKIKGPYYLSMCDGRMKWPNRGVYFFFEPGEFRKDEKTPRVVRVGTHAVSSGSKTTLWSRLRSHRGHRSGGGNHRGSVFRLLVGSALIKKNRYSDGFCTTWGIGNSAPNEIRQSERNLEMEVSNYITNMPFLWVAVDDEPSVHSKRKYIERNAIALLSGITGSADIPSPTWLGYYCVKEEVQKAGLWNQDHVREDYDPAFLGVLEGFISQM